MQIERLGPYKLGKKIGRGGMGAVYEAVREDTGERAAIKLLSVQLSHDEGFRERFKAEIETLRKLNHPNIVRLFGFGEQDELLYYAMELVEGHSLEDELREGRRFDWQEVTDYGVQICRALKHAHDRGVIHRDLKPANLMLTPSEQVKLSDFGIAKLFGSTSLTADGGVLGTAEFMSPEQADGRPASHRSDLYSLGGVMYALLARRPPFRARSLVEMLQLQRYADPDPVRRYNSDAPEELERIISQLLEKDPERRIPTAMVLSRRLEAMRHGLTLRRGEEEGPPTHVGPDEQHEFVVSPPTMAAPTPPSDVADGDTRDGRSANPRVGPADKTLAAHPEQATSAKTAAAPHRAADETDELSVAEAPARRFTHVAPGEDRGLDAADDDEGWRWISPQTLLLVASAAALAAIVWYLLQPPSADKLYDRIIAAADRGDTRSLAGAKDDMQEFLARYPDDRRAAVVKDLSGEVELYWAENRLELRAKRSSGVEGLSTAQRAYVEAVSDARARPEQAIAKLQAVIDLYGDPSDSGAATAQVVQLARKRLERIEQQVRQYASDDAARLLSELDRADRIAGDDPAGAEKIRRALIELYADKPWAAQVVARARQALEAPAAASGQAGS